MSSRNLRGIWDRLADFVGVLHSALILHYTSYPSIQLEHVQCFLLMSSFLCSVNCLPQAWLLVGQAVRAAQDIGLHVSSHTYLLDVSCSRLP